MEQHAAIGGMLLASRPGDNDNVDDAAMSQRRGLLQGGQIMSAHQRIQAYVWGFLVLVGILGAALGATWEVSTVSALHTAVRNAQPFDQIVVHLAPISSPRCSTCTPPTLPCVALLAIATRSSWLAAA